MRVRWYAWAVAFIPAVAGVVSLISDRAGDFRSSGLMAGVAVTLGALAVLLALRRPWRTGSGLRRLASIAGIGLLGVVAVGGLAGGLPDYLQEQFGWFVGSGDYGPRAVVVVDGGFVAIGDDLNGGVIWHSSDGMMWSRVTAAALDGLEMRDLVVTDEGLVAISDPSDSDDGVVLTSSDGQAWDVAARFGADIEFGIAPIALDSLDGAMVVVADIYGNDVAFFHGSDFGTLRVGEPEPEFDDGDFIVDVACASQVCVAVGGQSDIGQFSTSSLGAAVWRSTDGERWDVTDHSFGRAELSAVAATETGFVVVGNDSDHGRGIVWTSLQGQGWAQVDHDAFENAVIDGIVNLTTGLVAFGRDLDTEAILLWSDLDGQLWDRSTVDSTAPVGSRIRSVATNGTVLVAMGIDTSRKTTAVWTSRDGRTWQRLPHDDVAFGSR